MQRATCLAITVAVGCLPSAALAAPDTPAPSACLPPDTVQALAECKPAAERGAKRTGAPALALPASGRLRVPTAEATPKKQGPGLELDSTQRTAQTRSEQRKLSLLQREIALVERVRSRGRAQPTVLIRLGQLYFELGHAHERAARELDQPQYEACRGRTRSAARCKTLRDEQQQKLTARDEARAGNVRALAGLLADHPRFERSDEALFALGFALDEMSQHDRARAVYHRLIKDHPGSIHVPYAYLAFAEHYFRAGDMGAARQFYAKVTEFPPERNPVHGYALYKQAWCLHNLDDFTGALKLLVATIELARERPEQAQLAPLLRQARQELVIPYARVGSPNKALAFFTRYAADDEQALETYEHLGELYFDTGQWPEARTVYHGLMAERPRSPRVCEWQRKVADTVVASGDKPGQVREATRLLDIQRTLERGSESAVACAESAASLVIALAVAWHREAVGTETQPGTRDASTMAQAEALYAQTLEAFPELDTLRFPDFAARDRPTRYRLAYYRAELLWQLERFAACGPAFDAVLAIDARGELTEDSAYGAVLCYDRVHQGRYRALVEKPLTDANASERLAPRELDPVERAMLAAFERYLCYVPEGPEALRIQYRRARVYYEANQFARAAALFERVARAKDDPLAPIAANLYLDALNVLGMREPERQAACHDAIAGALEPLAALHCQAGAEGAGLCDVIAQLRCDLLRAQAERHERERRYRQAAETYVAIARRQRGCGRMDEVLYNAAIDYEAARLLGRAIRVRKALVDQYPDSPWAARSRFLLGANYHALAFYEQAAEHYEDFARRHPNERGERCSAAERERGGCPDAVLALSNAIFFRLGLGDEQRAAEAAALFERQHARRDAAAAARVRFSLGSLYERRGDHARIERHYREFLRDHGRHAAPHERIAAELRIGRALHALGRKADAGEAFAAVEAGFGALPALAADAGADAQRSRALARLSAAEAAFNAGELARAAFDAIALPRLRVHGGDRAARSAAFQRWRERDFTRWIESKTRALAAARASYERVASYEAPQWSIAAAARVGDMYLAFSDAFREAPLPPELQSDEELGAIYRQALDEASAPWVEQAKGAFEFCLKTATRVRSFDASLTHCEHALFALDPRAYPRAAELRLDRALELSALANPQQVAR